MLWEALRPKKATAEERQQLVDQIISKVRAWAGVGGRGWELGW